MTRRLVCPRCGGAGNRILVDEDDGEFVAVECIGCKFTISPELLGDVKSREELYKRLEAERSSRPRPHGPLEA